jgi:hypothetical protein
MLVSQQTRVPPVLFIRTVVSMLDTVRVVVGPGACVEIYATHFICNLALTNPPSCSHSPISAISHNIVCLPNPLLPHSFVLGRVRGGRRSPCQLTSLQSHLHQDDGYRTRFVTPQTMCFLMGW